VSYDRKQMIGVLVKDYGCEQETAEKAVDAFLTKEGSGVEGRSYVAHTPEDGNTVVEGDLDSDVEHVYSTQRYWDDDYLPAHDKLGSGDLSGE
jgi:hypothetical protein